MRIFKKRDVTKYYSGDRIEDEMGRACGTYWGDEKYTGCPRRNVPDFEKVFLMLKYTDIIQNTYIQS
jgi:hypothetical protein